MLYITKPSTTPGDAGPWSPHRAPAMPFKNSSCLMMKRGVATQSPPSTKPFLARSILQACCCCHPLHPLFPQLLLLSTPPQNTIVVKPFCLRNPGRGARGWPQALVRNIPYRPGSCQHRILLEITNQPCQSQSQDTSVCRLLYHISERCAIAGQCLNPRRP